MARPEIRYVRSGGVALAYQVLGAADTDLVYVPDYMSNLVFGWEYPRLRAFYLRLADHFRVILFDKRGTGLSDHGGQFAALETRMEDLHAVLDAAGSARTVILASHEGCAMAALYAATYPERTAALALFHPSPGYEAQTPDVVTYLADLRDRWGTDAFAEEIMREGCPSLLASDEDCRWFADYLRVGATPAVAYALNRAFQETDLRDVLPAVRVPTLILHRAPERANALEVASRIPSARAVQVSGEDYLEIYLSPDIVDVLAELIAEEEPPEVPESVLATVMFTDIVGSTEHAASLGDRAWRDLLARHHAVVRRELQRFRGEERDTAGDGFFATFDGPARAVRCGQSIVDGVKPLGLDARIGVHIGECELHEGKLAGLAVVIGVRISAEARGGEVLVSGTVKDLVAGSGLEFAGRGQRELKGIPGQWSLYAVA
ncbi:MAG TPA: adenylate/guanylate cyclase domain-containing protein [Gaiellales bacterium]|jgi:class 3 adenylate cyclase|nr:adenylate/guanylate cyclase domain-containing protein [Gaiellales bacterium]